MSLLFCSYSNSGHPKAPKMNAHYPGLTLHNISPAFFKIYNGSRAGGDCIFKLHRTDPSQVEPPSRDISCNAKLKSSWHELQCQVEINLALWTSCQLAREDFFPGREWPVSPRRPWAHNFPMPSWKIRSKEFTSAKLTINFNNFQVCKHSLLAQWKRSSLVMKWPLRPLATEFCLYDHC